MIQHSANGFICYGPTAASSAPTAPLGPDDLRGLSPLLWSHVNAYGVFRLDLTERLPLAA